MSTYTYRFSFDVEIDETEDSFKATIIVDGERFSDFEVEQIYHAKIFSGNLIAEFMAYGYSISHDGKIIKNEAKALHLCFELSEDYQQLLSCDLRTINHPSSEE